MLEINSINNTTTFTATCDTCDDQLFKHTYAGGTGVQSIFDAPGNVRAELESFLSNKYHDVQEKGTGSDRRLEVTCEFCINMSFVATGI